MNTSAKFWLGLAFSALALPAAAGDCYRCVIAPPPWQDKMECQARFGTGGENCLATLNTCWTGGTCGSGGGGVCDDPEDCIFHRDSSDPSANLFKLSAAGKLAIAKRPDMLGQLLRDMVKLTGGVNLGPIVQGMIRPAGSSAVITFAGMIGSPGPGVLRVVLIFDQNDHPPVRRIDAELTGGGASGTVSRIALDGSSESEVW